MKERPAGDALRVPLCTCADVKCPFHPSNHDGGCAPCVAKNLREREIPSCFFHAAGGDKPTEGWHFEDFAALVAVQGAKPGMGSAREERPVERLQAFEAMLADLLARVDREKRAMDELKAQGREKSATYRQYMGNRLVYARMLEVYREYGLL